MESAKRWLVLGLLVAVAIALWWLEPSAREPRSAKGAEGAEAIEAAQVVPAEMRDAPRDESNPPVATSARSQLQAETPAAEELGPLAVRVVSGAERVPVSGARVLLAQPWFGADPELARLRDELAPLERRLEVHGLVRTTDERGLARFPTPLSNTHVTARLGDRFATATLAAGEPGPVELVLEPDPPITVRVEDERGEPRAGIPVGLCGADAEGDYVRARTDTHGLAVLRAAEARSSLGENAFVELAFPLREPVLSEVDLAAPPATPIVLRMPPTGSIEVELVDARGAPWLRTVDLGITLAPRVLAELGMQGVNGWGLHVDGGHALIEPVGLGLELALDADTEGHEFVTRNVQGPFVAGERVAARIELGHPWPVLTGRLIDGSRQVLGPGRLAVHWSMAGSSEEVGPDGRFRWTFGYPEELDGKENERLEFTLDDEHGALWFGDLPVPALAQGDVEHSDVVLGDVVLAPFEPAVSGTVRDESGAPVRGAPVSFYLDPTPGARFSGEGLSAVVTDALGRFALREHHEGERIAVYVEAPNFVPPEPIVVPLGTQGLEVVLQRGGTVVCVFVSDTNWQPDAWLERDGVRVLAPLSSGYRKLLLGPVAPGVYTLHYSHPWSELEGTVDGIVVRAGERTVDPRLLALDVRALVSAVALTVVDAENRPVSGLVVELYRKRSGDFADCHSKRDGERWLVWAGPLPLRMRLLAPGFRTLELGDVDSDRRVVLERGRLLRVELAGALPELPEGWTIEGRLERPEGAPYVPFDPAAPLVFAGGVAEVSVSLPGRYAFSFRIVESHAGEVLDTKDFWDEPRTVLEVEDGEGVQRASVRAPSSALVDEILTYIRENG